MMRNSVLEELRVRRFADIQEEMCFRALVLSSVLFAGFAFPVCHALMSRKTTEKVFQKVQQLVP